MGRCLKGALLALALAGLPVTAAAQPDDQESNRIVYSDVQAAMEAAADAIYGTLTRLEPDYGADMNFVLGVVPLQQAVIDMAVVVLKYGEDPEVAALAEEMLAVQEEQMARIQAIAEAYTRVD